MFTKYFEVVKTLFEAVFRNSGENIRFTDYLYVLGFTFAIIGGVIAAFVMLALIVVLPVLVYKKLTKKTHEKITEYHKSIESGKGKDAFVGISKEEKTLKIKKICFSVGVIFVYVPFVIPTLLFIISKISTLF